MKKIRIDGKKVRLTQQQLTKIAFDIAKGQGANAAMLSLPESECTFDSKSEPNLFEAWHYGYSIGRFVKKQMSRRYVG